MDDLIAFLRFRLDEREHRMRHDDDRAGLGEGIHNECACRVPDQVIADVNAARRIIDALDAAEQRKKVNTANFHAWCDAPVGVFPPQDKPLPDGLPDSYLDGLRYATRLLALPYAGHPDYRGEWRP